MKHVPHSKKELAMFEWPELIANIYDLLNSKPSEFIERAPGESAYIAFSDAVLMYSPEYEDLNQQILTVLYGVFGNLPAATCDVWKFELTNIRRGCLIKTDLGKTSPPVTDNDSVCVAVCLVNRYKREIDAILRSVPKPSLTDLVFSLTDSCPRPYCNLADASVTLNFRPIPARSLADIYQELPSAWRKVLLQQLRRISKEYSLSVYPTDHPQELRLVCNSTPEE